MPESNHRPATSSGYAVRRRAEKSHRGLWVKLTAAVLLVGLISGGVYFALTANYFSVVRVESGSYRFTVKDDLDQVLGGYLGKNIWTLSEARIAESLAGLPWVKDLKVFKRLPGTIEVDFLEWRPVLALDIQPMAGVSLVMVEDGRILEYPEHLPLAALPVLVGVECFRDSTDGVLRLDSAWTSDVLDLVAAMATTGLETTGPIDFLVARPEGFAIVLQEGQGRLLVGREEFAERLARFMAARDHLEPGLQMDLRFRDKITCSRL
jgi:hypothetical protein